MSQAAFWEIIAVPDIRLQTAVLARNLSGCLHAISTRCRIGEARRPAKTRSQRANSQTSARPREAARSRVVAEN
jgi:hypothetical protein